MSEKLNITSHWWVLLIGGLNSLTFSEKVSLGFFIIGIITLGVNWFYKHKNLQIEKKKLTGQCYECSENCSNHCSR